MILTTHALVGAALGKKITNIWILLPVTIILHYLMDTLRHGEYLNKKSTLGDTLWKVACDLCFGLGIIFAYLLYAKTNLLAIKYILLGAFFSMFPDMLTFLHWKLKVPFLGKPYQLHQKMHRFPDFSPERAWTLRNSANDIVISLLAIALLFLL